MVPTGKESGIGEDFPRLLVVGAGVAGKSLVQEIQHDKLPVLPVAFLDDDPKLIGTEVCGLPVLGNTDDLVRHVAETGSDEVLMAIPSSGGSLVRRLVILCKRAGVPFRIVPGLRDIIEGEVHFKHISEVKPDHLLGRETAEFHDEAARKVVSGQVVMVTGAGGSIGGQLCHLLLKLAPKELILLGRGENSIFEMMAELAPFKGATRLTPVIADVRDICRMRVLATRLQPSLILHAAAHKHVPLMEENPEEAVLVNVGGTANLIEFSNTVKADRFVLISTDKAVAPESVMGATKKLAEMLVCRAAGQGSHTRFMTVRFGNVLGSRGSVVPFFMQRIAAGLPLPITHPEMTRYFMTIKEAARLVIEAMVMGEQGATYILNMGEPVSILELANNILVLCGYDPSSGDDGPGIEFIGLRPGERLHESLNDCDEEVEASNHPLINQTRLSQSNAAEVAASLDDLRARSQAGDIPGLRQKLASLLGYPCLATSCLGSSLDDEK